MTDEEILKIMLEHEQMKKALQEIAEFDAMQYHGCIDEWEEAHAFSDCKIIAAKALENISNL